MKKYDAAHPMWNRILGVVYLPVVFFCYLGLMAGERAIGETNVLIIAGCYIVAYGLFTVALTTYPALVFSGRSFDRGNRIAGHLLRWYPLWMILVIVLIGDTLLILGQIR